MARYTCSFLISTPAARIHKLLSEVLERCHLDVIHATDDYVMAREVPGQVAFPLLVTVEVLIDRDEATQASTGLHFIIKNEELPLKSNNHCRRMSDLLSQTVQGSGSMQLLSSVTG